MTDVTHHKDLHRRTVLEQLKHLNKHHRVDAGNKACAFIDAWLKENFLDANIVVAFFAALSNEICTQPLDSLLAHRGIRRVLPYVGDAQLRFALLDDTRFIRNFSHSSLRTELETSQKIDIESAQVIFVPGLAFDKQGHRLGRGLGYYDRALSKIKKTVALRPCLVGLGLDEQVFSSIPFEEHDVVMDFICTPGLGMHKTA